MLLWSSAVVVAGWAAPVAGAEYDWPQWRGSRVDGISQETGWSAEFGAGEAKVLWTGNVGIGCSSVTVSGGRMYTAGWENGNSTVFAFDAQSGDVIWEYSYAAEQHANMHEGGPGGTPATDGQSVFMFNRVGEVLCLDAAGGDFRWSRQLAAELKIKRPGFAFTGSPVVNGQQVLVDVGSIVALDRESGETIWSTKNYGPAYSTPVPFELQGRPVVATFPEYGLVLLDSESGEEIASHRWKTQYGINAATPVVSGSQFFISSGYNTGAAMLELAGESFSVKWENHSMHNHMATCVLIGGYLYGFDEGVLKCVSFDDGEEMWSKRGFAKGTVTAAGDRLIVLSTDGDLVIVKAEPSGYVPLAKDKVLETRDCWVAPVLVNGLIYCRGPQGQLVCVDVRGE